MKSEEQLAESIERFREVFWEKCSTGRPPLGVVNRGVFLPIKYLSAPFERSEVTPEDVNRESVMTDYEFGFAAPAVTCDDWIPYSAPWRAIPWLEACCGCPVRYSSGSLCPEHFVWSLEALDQVAIPADNGWLRCMERQTEQLVASAPADCWISPSILRGPSDVIAAMRGQSEFFIDLHDDPAAIDRAAGRVNRLLLNALDVHFRRVEPKRGGFGHIYGYWAPEETVVIQEDAMGTCSPAVYRDVFQKYSTEVVEHLGECVLFHLHSTGYQHYRHVLDVPGIAGLQLTVEAGAEAETNEALAAIRTVAAEDGMTMPEIAVRWALAGEGVTSVLVGARNEQELEANVRAASEPLDPAVIDKLNAATAALMEKLGPSFDYYEHTDNDRTRPARSA